jgi:hypothetical protein
MGNNKWKCIVRRLSRAPSCCACKKSFGNCTVDTLYVSKYISKDMLSVVWPNTGEVIY